MVAGPSAVALLVATSLAVILGLAATAPVTAGPRVRPLPVDAPADYQLGGAYRPPAATVVVVRDRLARPAGRGYDICYVNAFQTQPDSLSWWRRAHPGLLLRSRDGRLVSDPGWPGEFLLDTSSARVRHRLGAVVGRWLARCGHDGFDAVEPDNLDSFTRSRGLLSRADNLAFARVLAGRAHAAGIAIAQKNTAGVTRAERRRIGFDFAVAEECAVYRECGSYARAYGRRILEIEYTDNGRAAFRRACRRHGEHWSILLRDRLLRRPAHQQHAYREC